MALRRLESTADALGWLAQRGVRTLATDSRRVGPGDAFIAWPGYAVDGRRFVPQALAAGASACLVEADGAQAFGWDAAAPIAALSGLKAATGTLASAFMGAPSERLAVIAVTGTNGKTSTSWWVAQALTALGRRCGVIGTLGVGEPPAARPAAGDAESPDAAEPIRFTGMTTPDPVTVQAGLKRFVDAGLQACAIEATSIGLEEHRLAGTKIGIALFTNLTQDHLDYHGSMEAYWRSKARLFAWPGLRAAVVNVDDGHGAELARSLDRAALDVWTYSAAGDAGESGDARLRATSIRYDGPGLAFELHEGDARLAVGTQLIGVYNVSNLLATIGALRACGVPLAEAARVCAGLTPVPGRMDRVNVDPRDATQRRHRAEDVEPGAGWRDTRDTPDPAISAPQIVVDYAHTPDALEKALLSLQPFAAERGGALWCVFGCGGNRDAGKRPLMGAIAQALATQIVITSDNPRLEEPDAILAQIVAGLPGGLERVDVIEDGRAAIAHAVRRADARDVILIAGKGHEDYQDIGGVRQPFSDVDEARAALRLREGTR